MGIERTLSIIKPDAVGSGHIGQILARFEAAGLRIIAVKMIHLTKIEVEDFYKIHKERAFFQDLVRYMILGPILVQVLEGESAIDKNRKVMGATNPQEAAIGTIRKDFATSIDKNAVHGSDAQKTAEVEIAFFFQPSEICSRM